MRTVGVRDLKAHLSRVLRDVQAGEQFLVTDRGRVVAELRSPDATTLAASPIERALARMAAEGHLRLAESSATLFGQPLVRLKKGTAQRLIDEDRGPR